jgi:hypothetical protein
MTGIGVVTDFTTSPDFCLIKLEIDNPNWIEIEIWVTTKRNASNAESSFRSMVFSGSNSNILKTFRTKPLSKGIREEISIELVNAETGGVILKRQIVKSLNGKI